MRFLSCFCEDYSYDQVKAVLECEGERFHVTGNTVVNLGWKKISIAEDDEEEEADASEQKNLPELKKGEIYKCKKTLIKALKTTPPSRYTEASLLSAMENPSRFITDKAMKEYIGGGLGTPATRADIIEKLYSTFYIEKKDNVIYPTQKGIQIIGIVPEELKEPLLTAKWEMRLEAISKGNAKKDEFISEMKKYASDLVRNVANSDASYVHENVTRTPCPVCGKMMLEVNGKKGKMLVCQDRECGYRENLSMITGARCPECHKLLELKGKDEKKMFVCKCGFRQKYEVYTAQKKEQSKSANKHFVNAFLKNQNKKEEKVESAFAAALKKALEKKK